MGRTEERLSSMTVSLHNFVDMYARALATADHLLTKGVAHAVAAGGAEGDVLGWRLVDDMNPLSFQLEVVVNFSRNWIARAAGLPLPATINGADLSVEQFHAEIASARSFLDGISAEHLAGRDEAAVTFKIGEIMEPTLPAAQWITGFATTNIMFHLSIAYAILRVQGVPLGKIDMFPTGL